MLLALNVGEMTMSQNSFWNRTSRKAYFNFIEREEKHIPGNSISDWESAEREMALEEKIKEEAYLLHEKYGGTPEENWEYAKQEIKERIQFLAFYMHESNIDKSPMQNWIEAQKLYISKF